MTWRVRWSIGGREGTSPIRPAWSQSGRLYEPWRSARAVALEWLPIDEHGPIDLGALVAEGYALTAGYLEVLAPDDRVIIAGPWRDPQYGPVGVPCRGRIVDSGDADTALIPGTVGEVMRLNPDARFSFPDPWSAGSDYTRQLLVAIAEWPDASLHAVEQVYPVVFGAPGTSTRPGSPALLVSSNVSDGKLMIAGHPVAAATVSVWAPRAITDRWRIQGENLSVVGVTAFSLRVTLRHSGEVITAVYSAPIGAVDIANVFDEWETDLNGEPAFSAISTATSTTTEGGVPLLRIVGNGPGTRYAVDCEFVQNLTDLQMQAFHPGAPVDSPEMAVQAGVPVQHAVDGRGATYAYVDLDDLTEVMIGAETQAWISWTGGEAMPGGAGDVLHALSSLGDGPTDHAAFAAMRSSLNRWKLAGYIDSQVSPLELMRTGVLPVLPVVVVAGEHGRRPELWPWVDGGDPELVLEHGRDGWSRETGAAVSWVQSEDLGGSALRYGWDPSTGTYAALANVLGDATTRAARAMGARQVGQPRETRWVGDETTANSLATVWASLASQPVRRIRYMADAGRYGVGGALELRVGQAVGIIDPAIGLTTSTPATVAELEQDGGRLAVVVYLLDNPFK